MTFRVIDGGRAAAEAAIPEHRRFTGTPLERARCDVINRVAAAIHEAGSEEMPGYPGWEQWVDWAYEPNADPKLLEDVSNTISAARAAVAAMAPPEASHDAMVYAAISDDPARVCAVVEDLVKAVLS